LTSVGRGSVDGLLALLQMPANLADGRRGTLIDAVAGVECPVQRIQIHGKGALRPD